MYTKNCCLDIKEGDEDGEEREPHISWAQPTEDGAGELWRAWDAVRQGATAAAETVTRLKSSPRELSPNKRSGCYRNSASH